MPIFPDSGSVMFFMQVIILQEPREIENGSNTLYKEGESRE
jgi:hypothetical protein